MTGDKSQRRWCTAALLLVNLVALAFSPALQAQSPALSEEVVKGIEQYDLDGDNSPDQTTIFCTFATDDDRVLVFDSSGDMAVGNDWRFVTDFDNDTWIFDVGADGSANLIVEFSIDGAESIARFYDDTNGDGRVDYRVSGTEVVISESAHWSLEITAETGWYTSHGQPNMNVRARLDKPSRSFEFMPEEIVERYLLHDGVPDVSFELRDSDFDGVPEYYLVRLLADIPARYSVGRTKLYFNAIGTESKTPPSAYFWPFLHVQPPSASSALRYFDLIPGASINWQTSSILGFFLNGYPIGEGYHINSTQSIQFGEVSEADFEVPHAYYDLAANNDAFPELNIRLFRVLSMPWQEIRFSWNQFNPGTLLWDFKLGLMSDHTIEEVVDFDGFGLRMIPYQRLPSWVTEREWKLTTFVAREGGRRESSEGLYAWTPWSGADPVSPANPSAQALLASNAYLTGATAAPPYEYFTDIWDGYRGEYNLIQPSRPTLYFSPIDRRLHLYQAQRGICNLGQGRYVVYGNTNGDEYLDHWIYIESGQVRGQLYATDSYLLLTCDSMLVLSNVNVPLSAFETLPPRNHAEWLALGRRLEEYHTDFAPNDFAGMSAQFGGPQWRVEGASLRGLRPDDGGFRFVLGLQPGFTTGASGGLDVGELQPGEYVVTASEGAFSVQPLTPAQPEVVPGTLGINNPTPQALESLRLEAVLHNAGLEDQSDLTVRAYADGPDEAWQPLGTTTITLLAGQSVPVGFDWTPRRAGEWRLALICGGEGDQQPPGSALDQLSLTVHVAASPQASAGWLLHTSHASQPLALGAFLAGLVCVAASLALVLLRKAKDLS